MTKEILEQLFDSPIKVKLLKLFLRNQNQAFSFSEIIKRTKSNKSSSRRELNKLKDIKFLNVRNRSKVKVYSVNPQFDFYGELKSLVLKSSPTSQKKMLKRLKRLGGVKLAIIAGTLINVENSRADILLVGDNINEKKFAALVNDLEADVGKELNYVLMDTADFYYRFEMFDRFLRDIMEQPHTKLINKLKV